MDVVLNYTFMAAGISAGILFLLSFLSGLKIVKIKYKWHKRIGIAGFICMCLHAVLMIVIY